MLLAHATGFHGLVWRPLAAALVELAEVHAVAPDLRGHGATPLPPDRVLDWDGFADDVLATVDALGLEDPVGVGHSKGGAALLRAEARRPGTFRALWCYEPIVFPAEVSRGRWEDNPLATGALRRRDHFASRADALVNFSSKPPMASFDSDALEAYVEHGFEDVDDGGVRLRCRPEVEAETYRLGGAHDTFERLGDVRCPTVVACGAAQAGAPAALAVRIAEALPDGELARFEELGHFGPLEQPALLAGHIVRTSIARRDRPR